MEKRKLPFAVHAARWSVLIPVLLIFFNLYISQSGRNWELHQSLIVSFVAVGLYIAALILASLALRGMKVHGSKGWAIAGLIINGFFIVGLALVLVTLQALPSRLKGRDDAYIAMLKEDLMKIQAGQIVEHRSFSVDIDGAWAPGLQVMNDYMVELADAGQDYYQKVAHIDIGLFLEPDRLIDPNSIAFSKQQVAFLQTAYQEFIANGQVMQLTMGSRLQQLDLPDELKSEFIDGFMESVKQDEKLMTKLKKIHYDYTQSVIQLLTFMENKTDVCVIEDGYLVFDCDDDLKAFNQRYDRVVELGDTLLNMAAQVQEDVMNKL